MSKMISIINLQLTPDEGRELFSVLDMATDTLYKLVQHPSTPEDHKEEIELRLGLQMSVLKRLQLTLPSD
jgi:hypothetical protein